MNLSLRRCALALALSVLVLTGCSTAADNVRDKSGAIVETNDSASVFDMKEGDCFNDPGTDVEDGGVEEVETLPAVPCSQDHDFEVYESYTIDGEDFPGDASAEQTADDVCVAEFDTYIGLPYDDSELDMYYLWPTEASWDGNDRQITCLAFDPEAQITGSLKGAKR